MPSVLFIRNSLTQIWYVLRSVAPWIFLLGVVTGLLFAYGVLIHVPRSAEPYLYQSPETLSETEVAIVFGAGIYGERPSRVLAERIQGAVALHNRSLAQKYLFTGDNSSVSYDEVTVMQEYAIEHDIPSSAITLDYAGFSTYESCYRARHIFGVTKAILISQAFHLERAIYTCRQLGIEAVGLATSDWLYEPDRQRPRSLVFGETRYGTRELLAKVKALWQLHITRPEPTFLGPFEGLN